MAAARKGLGRGLEAILGENKPEEREASARPTQTLSLGDIRPDPDQPRKSFTEESLEELAESIRAHGLIQPILVRPDEKDGQYILVAGERRWRAAAKAGLHDIPVLIKELDDRQTAELALIENLQREDLNPIEEANAYARMRDAFNRKPGDIAESVGKSRSHVANMLRLTNLPDGVKLDVMAGRLSMGHARALLSASDPVGLARKVIAQDLSVRETERLANPKPKTGSSGSNAEASPKTPAASGGSKDADTKSLERDLEAALGLSVAIEHTKKGGTVTLTYDTLEQLDDICRRLMGSMI